MFAVRHVATERHKGEEKFAKSFGEVTRNFTLSHIKKLSQLRVDNTRRGMARPSLRTKVHVITPKTPKKVGQYHPIIQPRTCGNTHSG